MASAQVLDIKALMVPMAGENPAGEDLIHEGTYDTIRRARQEGRDRDALEPGMKTADWSAVIATATQVLTTRSKDLQIAVWLVDALVKRHGFPGLRDGLCCLRELQQQFWPSLHPAVVHGDLEDRIRLLEWLNRDLPLAIRQVPLTRPGEGEPYSWLHWDESRTVENLGRQNREAMEAALADGKITGEQFDTAVAATSRAYYETLCMDLHESQEACNALDQVLDEKFGRDAPSLLDIKKALTDCSELVERIVKRKRELEPDSYSSEPGSGSEPGEEDSVNSRSGLDTGVATTLSGGVPLEPRNRADALRRLAAVAQYFRKAEPHSPIAYLVERAIRWGEMPLEKWLQEVIGNEEVLGHLRDTLGLQDADTGNEN
jgi:type VI secretion system protein ImpA